MNNTRIRGDIASSPARPQPIDSPVNACASCGIALARQIDRGEQRRPVHGNLQTIPGLKLHTPRDPALSAGLCCFELDGRKAGDVVQQLLERKVLASTGPYAPSYARLSAGLMNTPEEVDQALAAMRVVARAS